MYDKVHQMLTIIRSANPTDISMHVIRRGNFRLQLPVDHHHISISQTDISTYAISEGNTRLQPPADVQNLEHQQSTALEGKVFKSGLSATGCH